MDIDERPLLRLLDVMLLRPMCFPDEIRSTKDHPDLAWGFCFRSIILWLGPPIIDVVLEIPVTNELLYLILEGNALLCGVEWSPHSGSGGLNTLVCSTAIKTSFREETKSV